MLRWRYHGNVPLERFVLRYKLDLFHKQDCCDRNGAVQEDGDEPSLDVSSYVASGAMWCYSDHNRMTSRLTC
jgi:hypothetical protein